MKSKVKTIISLAFWSIWLGCLMSCTKESDSEPNTSAEIKYELSSTIFPNPERGFMHLYPVKSEGAGLNLSLLQTFRTNNITLIHRLYYLENFKDQPLSAAELTLIQTDLQILREAGLKCVLRFAYTDDMNGTDAPLAIVEQHLDQLKPIFEANKDVIAFVQAGFIGAWGEWHSSSNNLSSTENQKKVLFKLLSVLPTELMVQVRTPAMKQNIFNTTQPLTADIAYSAENQARVGHHNDCFMSGGTNYGTYSNVEAEKNYISSEALYVPTGGETCPPQSGYDPTCPEGRTEMQLLKWTYLNLDYYQPTINAWKNSGCFDEFNRYLGYRLALLSAELSKEATTSTEYQVKISLTNKGYAPLYNYKNTLLVLKNKDSGTAYEVLLTVDVRACKPNGTLTIAENVKFTGIPAGNYQLYLKIADQSETLKNRPEYAVRLANTDTWVEEEGLNNLSHELQITTP